MEKSLLPVVLKNVSQGRNAFRFQKKLKGLTFFTATLLLMFFSFNTSANNCGFLRQEFESINDKVDGYKFISSLKGNDNFKSLDSQSSRADTISILQKCFNVVGLSQYYPKNINSNFKPLTIMQHAVSFSANLVVLYADNSITFKNKAQIKDENIDAYFYFNEFKIDQSTAKIEYSYHYDQNTSYPKSQMITLELTNSGNIWNVTSTKMEAR